MTVAKQKAFAADGWTEHVRAVVALSGAPQYSYFYKKFLLRAQGAKDVADVDPAWTTLDSSRSFVALDRMAWAWSSARRHRRRTEELHFICPDRDRAPDQRSGDGVAVAR